MCITPYIFDLEHSNNTVCLFLNDHQTKEKRNPWSHGNPWSNKIVYQTKKRKLFSTNIDAVECFCSALVVRNLQRHIVEVLMPAVLLRTNTFKNFEHMWRTNFYYLGSRGREGNIFIPLYQFRSLANIQIIFCCFGSDLVHVITTMLLDNIYPPLQTNIWFYFHCILFEILCQILLQ